MIITMAFIELWCMCVSFQHTIGGIHALFSQVLTSRMCMSCVMPSNDLTFSQSLTWCGDLTDLQSLLFSDCVDTGQVDYNFQCICQLRPDFVMCQFHCPSTLFQICALDGWAWMVAPHSGLRFLSFTALFFQDPSFRMMVICL